MTPENQKRYQEFKETIGTLEGRRTQLIADVVTVKAQLENMQQELMILDQTITLHTGGMSTIEVLTVGGYAIVKWEDETAPLTLNQHQAPQPVAQVTQQPQAAPSQLQYQQQPTQQAVQPQPTITQQAQQQFAPPQQSMFGQQNPMAVPAGQPTDIPE